MVFTIDEIIYLLENISKKLDGNKKFLDMLDEKIGDGDHGTEISTGFRNAYLALEKNSNFNDWKEIFNIVGEEIISRSKGQSSLLYGNAFIKSSKLGAGKKEMTLIDLRDILFHFIEAIKEKGNCEIGDKTILDGLFPIYEETCYGIKNGLAVKNILSNCIASSKYEVQKTRLLKSKKGRATYLGDRSIGYQDPGATSALLIFEAIYKGYNELRSN